MAVVHEHSQTLSMFWEKKLYGVTLELLDIGIRHQARLTLAVKVSRIPIINWKSGKGKREDELLSRQSAH